MAKTNWQDPKTGEIISPHISGLQEAVGKIEESIGIDTVAETDIPLLEIYIADDDRCRIYQAPEGKRNWLLSPAPIIKKNGVAITNGFEIDYGGGAVIFTTPISESDILTADASYTVKIEGKQLSTNDYSDEEKLKNQSNEDVIKNLAGENRTTETVKGNADSILNLIAKVGDTESLATEEKTDLVLALNEVYNNLKAHEADMVSQLNLKANKSWGAELILPLENGWTGSLYIRKNEDLGICWLRGLIKVGIITDNTVIAIIPSTFEPYNTMPLMGFNNNTGMSQDGLYVNSGLGQLRILKPTAIAEGNNIYVNEMYKGV